MGKGSEQIISPKTDLQIANMHMERCLTSLICLGKGKSKPR
jgi:hypothetical protein